MRTPILHLSVLCLLLLLMHCHRKPSATQPESQPVSVGDNSRNSLDWPGTYLGSVPNTEGERITTSIRLRADGTYTLETVMEDDTAEPIVDNGTFVWEPDGGSIKLTGIDSTTRPIYYQVGENRLRQLDLVNQSIEGNLNDRYVLTKDDTGLRGSSWALTSLNGEPVDLGKSQPTLEFAGARAWLSGMAGCNRYSTEYSLVDSKNLDIPPPVATKMACPDLPVEQEFIEALMGTTTFERSGETLRLLDAAGAEVARFTMR
ncbi:META domain-containing protein [Lewinella sp. IMCC34191]|uniref:META domain-containing protein n=1 Tax=Lewinella sp. IMCC34191 TaxID=2259172 RepID=UPI000E26B02D|nr:META domain-containing protein [Lewinella sp. IMCC34191]